MEFKCALLVLVAVTLCIVGVDAGLNECMQECTKVHRACMDRCSGFSGMYASICNTKLKFCMATCIRKFRPKAD